MHQGQSQVVILKPTPVFLAFLAAKSPKSKVPSLQLLQTDNTAYVIKQQSSDEETLAEIERHFATMFRHEICRWLGDEVRFSIEKSFFDFLCCFKFELHSNILLVESSLEQGQQAYVIKPRSVLLHWSAPDEEVSQASDRQKLSQLVETALVMVKNFSSLDDLKPFFNRCFKPIFETSMSSLSSEKEQWPVVRSFQSFCRYFTVQIHTQLIHLS